MKRIHLIVAGFCTATVGLWLLGFLIAPPAMNARSIIHEVFYVNGLLAWGLMAIAVVIAARPSWLERVCGAPLDKLYRLHRSLGLWATALTVWHVFTKAATRPFLSLFTLEPASSPAKAVDPSAFEAFWSALRPWAVNSAWVVTILGACLIAISFVPKIRYALWAQLHRLFSVIFIVLVLHCIRLMDTSDFLTPFGWLNIAVSAVGCWYSVKLLIFGAGAEKTCRAQITDCETNNGTTILTLEPEASEAARALIGMKPGQFAFLKSSKAAKHPFSVMSVRPDGRIAFAVKAMKGWTATTAPTLKPGDIVEIEGPWGHFTPDFSRKRQTWVAAGVGIAPFYAWLEAAASAKETTPSDADVTLHWCVKSADREALLPRVKALAEAAGIALHVHESRRQRLQPASLFAQGPAPSLVAVCAGASLANAVSAAYTAAGGSPSGLYREHFEWRR